MKNKKPWLKTGWILAVSIALLIFIPLTVSAALPDNLTVESKTVYVDESAVKTPSQLSDGELYVSTLAETDSDLSSTAFTIHMSALGQQYNVTTTTSQKYDIVFVLDVSNSMREGSRISNMVTAANDAIDTLIGNSNKIGIISFATDSIVERELSTKDLDLSQYSSTNTYGTTDIININLRSNSSYGGTNIQGALNKAYSMLAADTDTTAVPVIILLSDGAPTYYYDNLTSLYTGSTGRRGDGTYTSNTHSGYTIMQAAYLKTLMDDLQIYTIPFSLDMSDSDYRIATATLNPTASNISSAYGLSSILANIKATLSASVQSEISYLYPDASYSATDSDSSLGRALTNIISNMKLKKPITETTVNGVLNDASYVTLTYTIGNVYEFAGTTMEITLNNEDYIYDLINGVYYYNPDTSSGTYKQEMDNIVLTVSGKTITWKIPASLLPCNTPEGADQVLASPIVLSFGIQLDEDSVNLEAGTYETNSSCTASFVPNTDDPFYYLGQSAATETTLATNTTSTTTQTKYFEAMYPYLSNDYYNWYGTGFPTLTGFGTGTSTDSITYVADPDNIEVSDCYDWYGTTYDYLKVKYNNETIDFNNISLETATATFSEDSSGQYTVSNFNDGEDDFADATVTSVDGNDVTVSYDNGKRSVTFEDISVSAVTASFQSNSSTPNRTRNVNITSLYIGGNQVYYGYQVESLSGWSGGYTIRVSYYGTTYTFSNVTFTRAGFRNYVSGDVYADGTQSGSVTGSQDYYRTSTSQTVSVVNEVENYRLIYANGTLTVQIKQNGSFVDYAVYTEGSKTEITNNGDGSYTVVVHNSSTSKTIIEYYIEGNSLIEKNYTISGNGDISLSTGIVTKSLESTGILTLANSSLSGDQYITSATLKSTTDTDLTTATSSGQAYVELTFTTTDPIKNLDIVLNDAASNGGDFSYQITAAKNASGSSILTNGELPTTLAAGTYKITFKTTITYTDASDKPATYYVQFNALAFSLSSGSSTLTLDHATDYEDQQVKVVLIPPLAY